MPSISELTLEEMREIIEHFASLANAPFTKQNGVMHEKLKLSAKSQEYLDATILPRSSHAIIHRAVYDDGGNQLILEVIVPHNESITVEGKPVVFEDVTEGGKPLNRTIVADVSRDNINILIQ